jgi:hypothetical protein
VSETADLVRALRRIRRRARGLAALEGAVAGAAIGLTALALGAAAWRARGAPVPWRLAGLAGWGAAALGAALAAARPISFERCARLLDAAIDRGGRPADRVLSALSFAGVGAAAPTSADAPLARAVVADALSRARGCAPSLVAPARRPRGLAALAGAALALVVVGAWPARAPGARREGALRAGAEALEPRLRIAADALDAERAELVAAAMAAERAGDVSLRALAREAHATLDALTNGALGRGEALDRLTTLAARAKEAADETGAEQAALRAAGKALDPTAATRALGRALGADDPQATDQALDALAARAGASSAAREEIASALGAAAAGVGGEAGEDGAESAGLESRRRLNREHDARASAAGGEKADPSARRLESLRRDLEDTSAGCRGDAEACAKRLRDGEGGLRRAAREAAQTAERRRLENVVRQMRERLRRGDLDEGSRERRFGRVARGEQRAEGSSATGKPGAGRGEEAPGAVASDEAAAGGEGGDEVFVDDSSGAGSGAGAEAEGAAMGAGASAAEQGAAAAANGAGRQAGADPLGQGATPPTRGSAREVRVRSSAGPTRSEVIEASAHRGFATTEYVRVFGDYQPVVEEALASGAVPEGRRYVVRRYFQLIRPRAAARGRAP